MIDEARSRAFDRSDPDSVGVGIEQYSGHRLYRRDARSQNLEYAPFVLLRHAGYTKAESAGDNESKLGSADRTRVGMSYRYGSIFGKLEGSGFAND